MVVYGVSDNDYFQAYRWNIATGDFDTQPITANVTDFSVDRNYPSDTSSQRVFAIYTMDNSGNPIIYSARSTAGSYGFDWVDEVDVPGTNLGQIAFAYGRGVRVIPPILGLVLEIYMPGQI